ncbi:MAG: sulfatase [Bryobacteraceae bacterium]|nr:sulfatase [Bryobacteraceae bacterium]
MSTPVSRRSFTAALAAASQGAAQTAGAKRPNILFLLSDDHSVPFLGCLGDPTIQTPTLDKLASEGMLFNRCFTGAPQCVPSRACYMTGRTPVAVRMGRFNSPLPRDIKTLPEHLRASGYYTGICRRNYHLDGPGRFGPVNQEIVERYNMLTFKDRVDMLHSGGTRNDSAPILSKFIDQAGAKPWFMWMSFNDPHWPWDKATTNPHDPAKLKLLPHMPDVPGMRDDLARHYDEIARVDDEISTVLKVLDQRGLRDNTIVFFAGDNGMAFPKGKGSLYDRGLNVPMMMRWPGVIRPGSKSEELVSGEDVAPTLLDAVGIKPAPEMSGRSYLRLLKGEQYEHRKFIYGARLYHGSAPMTDTTKANTFDLSRCVRSKRYKLIYNCTPHMEYWPVDSGNDPGWQQTVAAHNAGKLPPALEQAYFGKRKVWELYDLHEDPSELKNIYGTPDLQKMVNEMLVYMQECMMRDHDFLPLPMPVTA